MSYVIKTHLDSDLPAVARKGRSNYRENLEPAKTLARKIAKTPARQPEHGGERGGVVIGWSTVTHVDVIDDKTGKIVETFYPKANSKTYTKLAAAAF